MNNVEVYVLSIQSVLENPIEPLLPLFSLAAQQRILKYRFSADRNRTAYAELTARYLLSRKTNTPMNQIHFNRDNLGKPYWQDSNYFFNLSHSSEWIACSIGYVPNGVDVETAEIANCDIAQKYFLAKEYQQLLALPENERALAFLKMWTIKESYLKYTGKGLSDNLQTIDHASLLYNSSQIAAKVFPLSSTAILAICTEKIFLPSKVFYLNLCSLLGSDAKIIQRQSVP